ncbi:MAG: extracellular solute-binding protein [Eubacteriales bacterium]|nr:extracellular solute-binding protein [Eubacteriales bacterium]
MKKSRKTIAAAAAALTVLLAGTGAVWNSFAAREIVLEFAMFNGSNWDVAIQDSYPVIDEAIRIFEEEHPGVRIHYDSGIPKDEYSEWLSRRMLDDSTPDVMMILDQDFSRFAELGMLENLDVRMQEDVSFEREAYYQTALDAGRILNGQYALPMETVPYLMFVNKTLLNDENVRMPSEDYTFSDLYAICRRVTRDTDGDGQLDQFGIYKYTWLDAAFSNGAELFSADGTKCDFTSRNLIEAIRFVKSLNALNKNQKVTQETFDSGKVAFMPLSLAEYRTYKSYPYKIKKYTSFQWDVLPMPKGPSGDNVSIVDSLNVGISSRSRHKELAWEFLKLLTGDERVQMKVFEYMPSASVLRDVTESEQAETIIETNLDVGEDKTIDGAFISKTITAGRIKPKFAAYQEAVQLADGEILKLYDEDADLDNAMRLIQRKVQSFIDK